MRNEDYFFDDWNGNTTHEACPECGYENEITLDGKSDCEECGHKNLLPCSACKVSHNGFWDLTCNWQDNPSRCNAFPNGVNR